MIETSYVYGLIGGLMIGCAAALLLLGNGRVMGASGIIGGLVDGSARGDWQGRALFIAGLIAAPWAVILITGLEAATNATSNLVVLVAAGLLVGLGARLANGCTSGHGVCGISRLSMRGVGATVLYLLAGGLTVGLFRHVLGVI
ncbi:MAG: YeeE/YedE family protein [Pseudomonadota bacterium]